MKPRDQNFVNDTAAGLEPIARAAWPPRETLTVGGWICRFTAGYSHRANSVAALGFPEGADLAAAIARVESAYAARGLAPMFHITPLSAPAELEAVLTARGYVQVCPTSVMIAEIDELSSAAGEPGEIRFVDRGDGDFAALVVDASHSTADGNERLDILSRVPSPHACVLALNDGVPIACGLAVVQDGWAGFFLMRTNSRQRRRGHARRVMGALGAWSKDAGATRGYLQVEDDNLPARALYARAGFRDAYGYRFLRSPDGD